jgi:hypothetical protein
VEKISKRYFCGLSKPYTPKLLAYDMSKIFFRHAQKRNGGSTVVVSFYAA